VLEIIKVSIILPIIKKSVMAETVFLNENNVQVTNARFIVTGQTYAMNGVTSVKSVRENPSRTLPIILGILGLLTLRSIPFVGILLIGAAVAMFKFKKARHIVVLNTSGGEVKALNSEDVDYIVRIVNALNESIIHRG
jgi:hypothetical protein